MQAPATSNPNANVVRWDFSKVLSQADPLLFKTLSTGSGMAVAQASGNLTIITGTNANDDTILRSIVPFTGDLTLRAAVQLSQRITNNNFIVSLTDVLGDGLAVTVNSTTSITVNLPNHGLTAANVGQSLSIGAISGISGAIPGRYAIASIVDANNFNITVASWPSSGSGTASLFGLNWHRILYNGTTATSAAIDCGCNGWQSGDTTIAINTTAAPGHIAVMNVEDGVVSWGDMQPAQYQMNLQVITRGTRHVYVPSITKPMYLQIEALNGSSAPASTTTLTVSMLAVEQYKATAMQIVSTRPQAGTGCLPVNIVRDDGSLTVGTISAGTNLIGDVGSQVRATTGGVASFGRLVSAAASTNATSVKASPGRVYGITAYNAAASVRYLKLYNKASAPTVGTDTPVLTFAIGPAQQFNLTVMDVGIYLSNGIAYALTTGSADSDTGALTAADVVGLNILYA